MTRTTLPLNVRLVAASTLLFGAGCSDWMHVDTDDETLAPSTITQALEKEEDKQSDVKKQSPEEAMAHDLAIVARTQGWTIEEAAADRRAADAVGEVAAELAKVRPDSFVGSELSPIPGDPPILYIKGEVDSLVTSLVGGAPMPIRVASGQRFSFHELQERQERVQKSLRGLGKEVLTEFRLDGQGKVNVVVANSGRALRKSSVLEAVPADLRGDVLVEFAGDDGFARQNMFGGMIAARNGGLICMTGWAVMELFSSPGGAGVVTAGHCGEVNSVIEPGVGTEGSYVLWSGFGVWGDTEFVVEDDEDWTQPDDFYADSVSIRDTVAVEPATGISIGESICVYGRSSNQRFCMRVWTTSASCLGVMRLVRMSTGPTIGGDSGAGYSWNNTAYGSHVGLCSGQSVFSVADYYDEGLSVVVMTNSNQ